MAKNLKLKAARAAMDLTQEELAVKVNVTRQTINAIEKGDYNPSINLWHCDMQGASENTE